jgi:hypothetical protein
MSAHLTEEDVAAFERRAAEAERRLEALESGAGTHPLGPAHAHAPTLAAFKAQQP